MLPGKHTSFAYSIEGQPTYCPNELHLDPRMLQTLSILWPNGDSPLYRFSIRIKWTFFPSVLVELHIHHLPFFIKVLQPDVDIQRGREEVRHCKGNSGLLAQTMINFGEESGVVGTKTGMCRVARIDG